MSRGFRTLIPRNRSIVMLYWSRKRSYRRRSGVGRRTLRLSSVVGGAVLPCKYYSDVIGDTDIREYIELRRFESLSLHHVLQDIRISECKWLELERADDKSKKHTNVTESLKRRQIFEEFVFWYFNSFLLPLLSVSFLFSITFCTEAIVVSPHSM